MREWISVKDELPEAAGPVHIRDKEDKEMEAWFIARKGIFVAPDGSVGYDAIYWRPDGH